MLGVCGCSQAAQLLLLLRFFSATLPGAYIDHASGKSPASMTTIQTGQPTHSVAALARPGTPSLSYRLRVEPPLSTTGLSLIATPCLG